MFQCDICKRSHEGAGYRMEATGGRAKTMIVCLTYYRMMRSVRPLYAKIAQLYTFVDPIPFADINLLPMYDSVAEYEAARKRSKKRYRDNIESDEKEQGFLPATVPAE